MVTEFSDNQHEKSASAFESSDAKCEICNRWKRIYAGSDTSLNDIPKRHDTTNVWNDYQLWYTMVTTLQADTLNEKSINKIDKYT